MTLSVSRGVDTFVTYGTITRPVCPFDVLPSEDRAFTYRNATQETLPVDCDSYLLRQND